MRHTRAPYTGCGDVNTRLDLRAITRDRVKRPYSSVDDRPLLLNTLIESYFYLINVEETILE